MAKDNDKATDKSANGEKEKDTPHFGVHPSVVFQLGESLITDSVQALIELVKNCYDADATYAKIVINTDGKLEVDGARYPGAGGRIIVEDDGHGMDRETINSGWLLISNRRKRNLKDAKQTTPGGRTPLGDKGLGRLGVQRLGENFEIFTKTKDTPGYHFAFSWLDFETAPSLESVDVHLKECKYSRKHGTKVVISTLHEINEWRGQEAIKRLEQELSKMISPYRQIRDFMVVVEIDGKAIEMVEISDRIRDLAPIRYAIKYTGSILTIHGRARLDYFIPNSSKESELFSLIAESDEGNAFYEYLVSQKEAKGFSLSRSKAKKWFVEFGQQRTLDDLDKVQHTTDGAIANPGAFTGEVDSFDLDASAYKRQSVFDSLKEYRARIKDSSGVRVYRDGFAIRVEHDWLKLGAQWTSASSYYGLKPDNTLGYIALSARENMSLEETTDREGFKDTPFFRNFILLMNDFIRFTNKGQEFFRRAWTEFSKIRNETLASVSSRKSVEDLSRGIKEGLSEAAEHHKSLAAFEARFEASAKESQATVELLEAADEVTPALKQKIATALGSLEPLIEQSRTVIPTLSNYLNDLNKLTGVGQVLEDRIDGLRRQMDNMYETMALGLTAEALSHEIFNISDQLARRCKTTRNSIESRQNVEKIALAFVEYVNTSAMALRKQVSYLSPSLRYVREKRENIDIYAFLGELQEFYKARLGRKDISLEIVKASELQTFVWMNRGKLTQVIDNLILNSEYWLKEDIENGRLKSGVVTIEMSRPFLRIFDNGRGIDPIVEHALFEPFNSAKKKGRGLGLFIVKQLLDSEGCSIGVLPERNRHKRLFKFQIDLRGAFND